MKTKILIILSLPLFAFTCNEKVEGGGHEYITFINNTADSIDVIEKIKIHVAVNDTFLSCDGMGGLSIKEKNFIIEPGGGNRYWETDFKGYSFIQFFVLSKKLDFAYCDDKEKLKDFSNKYLLKRYQLTLEDLQRMNWTVVYPPEE